MQVTGVCRISLCCPVLLVAGDQCAGVQGTEEDDCCSASTDEQPPENSYQTQDCELVGIIIVMWCGEVRCGEVWCEVWCGVVRYGVVRCGVKCGVVW